MEASTVEFLLLLLATVGFITLNGFFVAAEFALVKVRTTRIDELSEAGHPAARATQVALSRLESYLAVAQIGITLASLGLGWVGEPFVARRVVVPLLSALGLEAEAFVTPVSFGLAFSTITFVHIVVGEQIPKLFAIARAEPTALWVARPMRFFHALFRPLVPLLNGSARAVLRLAGTDVHQASEHVASEDELRRIISAASDEQGGPLRAFQAEVLDNVFALGDRVARQVMTHRTSIVALDLEVPIGESVHKAVTTGHTRYPVIRGDIDDVLGFVVTLDLVRLHQRNPNGSLRQVLREIIVAPEATRIDQLLRAMQRKSQHLALVVDEYGGTSGLVSVHDLLAELVGNLPDESEPTERAEAVPIGERAWDVDGRMSVSDLEELLGFELECREYCDTVGGLAFWLFGRIPAVDESTEREGIRIVVTGMDGRRVSRAQIAIVDAAAATDGVIAP